VLVGYSYQRFDNFGRNANAANFGTTTDVDDMMEQLVWADMAARNAINTQWQQYEYEQGNRMRIYDLYSTPPQVKEYLASGGGLPIIGPKGVTGNKFSSFDELQSFFFRGNYNIGERFFLTASVRADGSTKFGGNNQYGIFPSGAVKWRLTEESFTPDFFDELAVRLGYGITGNQEIGHNLYTNRVVYAGVGLQNNGSLNNPAGLVNVAFANPDLQWEQTSQINFGIDYAFFNSRLNGSLDLYRKNTTKLLMQSNSAQPAPTPFVWENLDADVINSGIELTVNAVAVDQADFDVNVSFNIAYNDNIVKNLGAISLPTGRIHGQGLTGAYAQRIANNQPLFAYYVRPFSGYGADGLNKPEEDYQTFVGKSAIPKVNSGTSISARYKNFDMSIYFNGQFGHYVYNNIANAMFTKGSIAGARNVTPDVVSSDESKANAPDVSERFLEKGNFIRLQNLTFGYNVTVAKKALLIDKLRVYVTGQNLFVITDYSGLDPEVNVDKNIDGVPSLGIDYTAYPRARTLTFGLTATF
jgi:iron complex outermembrane receptor protein